MPPVHPPAPSPPRRFRGPSAVRAPRPEPVPPPLPPEEVAHQKVARAVDKLTRGMSVIEQHHFLSLLAADVVHRSALLDVAMPLDDRQEQAARDYLAWCQAVDRPPVAYRPVRA